MKTNIFNICLPMLLLCGAITLGCERGCEKDENRIWEIFPDSETTVVQNVVDGIEFKFCLLNEAGEAATVFNESENFIFLFSFKNLMNDDITVTTEFIVDDFYRVYKRSSNDLIDMGKPWTGTWCEYSLVPHEISLEPNMEKTIKCPWILTETDYPDHPLCMSESKDYLAIGEYVTSFDLDFHYKINNQEKNITGETFKINFKIQ
ncbi:MAG: hypothetical protein ACOX5K_03220 [Bacteroidales bacterium]|jgi:hypothetical protein